MNPVLSFENVRLAHGTRTVLEGVRLDLERGDLAIVRGRSGAGKSTLLRAAAGLQRPAAGSVRFAGKRVAWVPQEDRLDALHPVSAGEVVSAGLDVHERRRVWLRSAARARIDEVLASVGLEGAAHRRFRRLSGGERQRVLVARALMLSAELLVMDEPTSALDRRSAELVDAACAVELRRGAAVLLATHGPEDPSIDGATRHLYIDGCQVLEGTRT